VTGYCPAVVGAVIATWQVPFFPVVHCPLLPHAETTTCLPDTTPFNAFHEPSRVAVNVTLLLTCGELGEALKARLVAAVTGAITSAVVTAMVVELLDVELLVVEDEVETVGLLDVKLLVVEDEVERLELLDVELLVVELLVVEDEVERLELLDVELLVVELLVVEDEVETVGLLVVELLVEVELGRALYTAKSSTHIWYGE
jgi:hypothetical protein